MGYLDNSSITVDAILTTKGREILAKGGKLDITQFALGDDEIDYTLWNPNHPSGTNYYGIIIENLPLIEAIPDETQAMRSKLITIPRPQNSTQIVGVPFISVTQTSYPKAEANVPIEIVPITKHLSTNTQEVSLTLNDRLGYTAILSDATYGTLAATAKAPDQPATDDMPIAMGDATSNSTMSVMGTKFSFTPSVNNTPKARTGTITITGNATGGVVTIKFTIPVTTNVVRVAGVL